jgi:hypothetical protein
LLVAEVGVIVADQPVASAYVPDVVVKAELTTV